ncbi:hypothetical protein O1M54_43625 [Streptomyces diastatochromogenes]|nr:hypothetical protein [Streptomyces diastatochromogenes]
MTGGPELVRQYEMGPGNAFSEIEHAIVTAAVDARRLGHAAALSPELLAAAVVGYLPSTARVTGDTEWFAAAVHALSSADGGRLPALVPDRVAPGVGAADGYHPADYLDQACAAPAPTSPHPPNCGRRPRPTAVPRTTCTPWAGGACALPPRTRATALPARPRPGSRRPARTGAAVGGGRRPGGGGVGGRGQQVGLGRAGRGARGP